MDGVTQKSLFTSLKKITSCVAESRPDVWADPRTKQWSKGQRTEAHDPAVLRAYQAELDREKKLREARNAQKNAERAAMRMHYRRKYQLPTNAKDLRQVQAVGSKVVLPCNLAKLVQTDISERKKRSDLLSVFKNLNFNETSTHNTHTTRTHPHTNSQSDKTAACKVM
ncbi:complexin-4-like [Trichomycterus rosablanca]|uniref:complexin-4-like n=1 Tax=Trichomycterus rosablanca TaxID=2290929 RepID=UPI002F3515E9